MNERVFRLRIPVLIRKPTVIVRQSVTKTDQLLLSFFRARRLGQSVMKMNFNLSPSRAAKVRELLHQGLIVLLCGIEVSVVKPLPLSISEPIDISRVLAAPGLQPLFLDIPRSVACQETRHTAGLKVVRNRDDQVYRTADRPARKPLPRVARQAIGCVPQLTYKRIAHPSFPGTVFHRESLIQQAISDFLVRPVQPVSFGCRWPNSASLSCRNPCSSLEHSAWFEAVAKPAL